MWTNQEMRRLANGQMSDEQKKALEASITWWHDVLFAMETMKNDAPTPEDKDLMTKIIGHLRRRQTAMAVGLTKH